MLIISTRPVAEIIQAVSAALMAPPSASAGAGLPSVTAAVTATALHRTDKASIFATCADSLPVTTDHVDRVLNLSAPLRVRSYRLRRSGCAPHDRLSKQRFFRRRSARSWPRREWPR